MFNDESDKPRGCGILEFATTDLARKAVDKMHKFDLKGRKLVVKEDTDASRDRYGRITKGNPHGMGMRMSLHSPRMTRAPPGGGFPHAGHVAV